MHPWGRWPPGFSPRTATNFTRDRRLGQLQGFVRIKKRKIEKETETGLEAVKEKKTRERGRTLQESESHVNGI